ncbi:MAG: transposase [Candidatus Hydrogenedentes bacterium]|nr:transposase [Candidatus Hydrogenedentota bacterium]
MTNHIHMIAALAHADSLNLAIGRTHFLYTQLINRLHGRSGHLWQGRFHSCPMDGAYTMAAMRYVERNPVRAKMTRGPWTYRWSSAAAHTGGTDVARLLDFHAWQELAGAINWKEMLIQPDNKESVAALCLNTHTGRPLASDSFLTKLEHKLGRPRKLKPTTKNRSK